MVYVLASTHDKVKWYKFDPANIQNGYELLDVLDLRIVPRAANKETAKLWAKALGLSTFKYVRL